MMCACREQESLVIGWVLAGLLVVEKFGENLQKEHCLDNKRREEGLLSISALRSSIGLITLFCLRKSLLE